MPYALTLSCLVLASYDVGEADRFLILLTRERGRLAARVPGARRLKSRFTSLLPLTIARLEVKELKTGFLVTGAPSPSPLPRIGGGDGGGGRITEFLLGTQACELLLALLLDDEPVPEIFDATVEFLSARQSSSALLAYTFRLLKIMGLLAAPEDPAFAHLSTEERRFLAEAAAGFSPAAPLTRRLKTTADRFLAEHALRPLKAPTVAEAMASRAYLPDR